MTQYMDLTKTEGCIGILAEEYEIIDFEKTEQYQKIREMMHK